MLPNLTAERSTIELSWKYLFTFKRASTKKKTPTFQPRFLFQIRAFIHPSRTGTSAHLFHANALAFLMAAALMFLINESIVFPLTRHYTACSFTYNRHNTDSFFNFPEFYFRRLKTAIFCFHIIAHSNDLVKLDGIRTFIERLINESIMLSNFNNNSVFCSNIVPQCSYPSSSFNT